jgi:hypothetical protein
MRYLSGLGATIALLAFAVPTGAETMTHGSAGSDHPQMIRSQKNMDPAVEVVMKDKTFRISKGETAKGFMLLAGSRADIVRTKIPWHMSSCLNAVQRPISARGNGAFIKLPTAAGCALIPIFCPVDFRCPRGSKEFQISTSVLVQRQERTATKCGRGVDRRARGEIGGLTAERMLEPVPVGRGVVYGSWVVQRTRPVRAGESGSAGCSLLCSS